MTCYPISHTHHDGEGQSWHVLEGQVIGPFHVDEIWDHISREDWQRLSPYFTPAELACKGTQQFYQYVPALQAYNRLRADILKPHSPNSAHRSPQHNRDVGGGLHSRHLAGSAYDVPKWAMTTGVDDFVARAKQQGFNGIGYYRTFVHIDYRARPATWGQP